MSNTKPTTAEEDFAMAGKYLAKAQGIEHLINYSELNKVIQSNCLPKYFHYNIHTNQPRRAKKVAEFKRKSLNCRFANANDTDMNTNKGTVIIDYTYMALYYDEVFNHYLEINKHRSVLLEGDTPEQYNKRIKIGGINSSQGGYFDRFVNNTYDTPRGEMLYKLTVIYDGHVEMIKKKNENRRKSKIIDGFHDENYNENWSGIVL